MARSRPDGHRLFRYLAVVAFAICYATILLGGNVMASDSGLACPDWPTCHGTFLPPLMGATGIEWSHRLSAFVLSFATAGLAFLGLLWERSRPVLLRLSVAAALTVVAQAFLGGFVVASDLNIAVVLLHFGLATVLFVLLLLLALLANLKSIPRHWVEWAWTASDEVPASERGASPDPALPAPPSPSRPGPISPIG